MTPTCSGCGKYPDELEEYLEPANLENMSPETGYFLCTNCYFEALEDDDDVEYL